jgi:hypothetical protein
LLHDVLSLRIVCDNAARCAEKAPIVAPHQQLESGLIARDDTSRELSVFHIAEK